MNIEELTLKTEQQVTNQEMHAQSNYEDLNKNQYNDSYTGAILGLSTMITLTYLLTLGYRIKDSLQKTTHIKRD
jgi:hypothetical protein